MEVQEARAELEIARARQEKEALYRDVDSRAEIDAKHREEQRLRLGEKNRLESFKQYGLEIARDLPSDSLARLTRDLEVFVEPSQFPAFLSDSHARAFVETRVREHRLRDQEASMRELEAARSKRERERKKLENEAQAIQREQTVRTLISGGKRYARWETLSWDLKSIREAEREVDRELKREVESDWSEDEVKDLVDEILDEFSKPDESAETEEEY